MSKFITGIAGSTGDRPGDLYTIFAKVGAGSLWCQRTDDPPVTDIKVVHGNQAVPGYERVTYELKTGGGDSASIWYQTGGKGSPILDLVVITTDEPTIPQGFSRILNRLNPGQSVDMPEEYLCYKTEAAEQKMRDPYYVVGDVLDCCDNYNTWIVATVVDMRTNKDGSEEIFVHFEGWADRWNEWIDRASDRVAPLGTRVKNVYQLDRQLLKFDNVEQRLKTATDKLAQGVDLDDHDTEFLYGNSVKSNWHFIFAILNSQISDKDVLVPRTVNFLKHNLQVIVNHLDASNARDMPSTLLDSFARIFNCDPHAERFFKSYGNDVPDLSICDGKYAAQPPQRPKQPATTIHLIDLVNHFGQIGGLDVLKKKLQEKDAKEALTLFQMATLTRTFSGVNHVIREDVLKDFAESLNLEAYFNYRMGYNSDATPVTSDEELKGLDKPSLLLLINQIVQLTSRYVDDAKNLGCIEGNLRLNMCRRLLNTQVLEKRIDAMNELAEICSNIRRQENQNEMSRGGRRGREGRSSAGEPDYDGMQPGMDVDGYDTPNMDRNNSNTSTEGEEPRRAYMDFLTGDKLVNWIQTNKIAEAVLNKSSHDQLIRMSTTLLRFLSAKSALNQHHIDLLFQASSGHSSRMRSMYDCLGELAADLPENQLDLLYNQLSNRPVEAFEDFDLEFLKNFTSNAVKATFGQNKWYGLDLFWTLAQGESKEGKVSKDISELSTEILNSLLKEGQFRDVRRVYLLRCLEKIHNGESVTTMLQLAEMIIRIQPIFSHHQREFSRAGLIENLAKEGDGNRTFNLLHITVESIARYVAEASAVYSANKDKLLQEQGKESKDWKNDQLVLVGHTSHADQLAARLKFLEFVAGSSDLELVQGHLDSLWASFHTVMPEDVNRILEWLSKALFAKSHEQQGRRGADGRPTIQKVVYSILTPPSIDYVFRNLLCDSQKMDFSALTPATFKCFESYFLKLNHSAGALMTPTKKFICVLDNKALVGLDALWCAVKLAKDDETKGLSRRFLTTLYIKNDFKKSSEEKTEVFKSFIEQSMKTIADLFKQSTKPSSADVETMIGNLVDMLTDFLVRIEKGEVLRAPRFELGEEVRAYWKSQRKTIYDAVVARVHPNGTYWLQYSDGDEDYDAPEHNLMKLNPEDDVITKDPSEAFPRTVLSNEGRFFDLFFEILSLGGSVGPKVWKLLTQLPVNQKLSLAISQLGADGADTDCDWKGLLPLDNQVKLLYSLQIVRNNVVPPPAPKETDDKQETKNALALHDVQVKKCTIWGERFVSRGGYQHLYNAFHQQLTNPQLDTGLRQDLISLLLELLILFFKDPYDQTSQAAQVATAIFKSQKERTVSGLLNLIGVASELKAAPPTKSSKKKRRSRWGSMIGPLLPGRDGEGRTKRRQLSNEQKKHGGLVRNAFGLLLTAVNIDQTLTSQLRAFQQWPSVTTAAILSNSNPDLRSSYAKGLTSLVSATADSTEPLSELFFPVLVECLGQIDSKNAHLTTGFSAQCSEFFKAINDLSLSTNSANLNLQSLLTQVAGRIKSHPVLEDKLDDDDQLLRGLLTLASALVDTLKTDDPALLNDTFECLFDLPDGSVAKEGTAPPKCKSSGSRSAGFKLLGALLRNANQKTREDLLVQLRPLHLQSHSGGKRKRVWTFQPNSEEKASNGYSGLYNHGCICYINSTLQQLFMMPRLRERLLAIDVYDGDRTTVDKIDPSDSTAYQLQLLMATLQEGEKMYGDAKDLCASIKDSQGNGINMSIQEDAGGFLTKLVDRVSTKLKGTEHARCFDAVMQGKLAHQLIGRGECVHYREREEPFYALTVEIKNKKNLYDSLDAYITGDMLDGYRCDQCNDKVTTLKRATIKSLPHVVCFVLKRFELSFETFQTVKVNSRLEFPTELDLSPYMRENLEIPPDEDVGEERQGPRDIVHRPAHYYQYTLRGVIIHMGGATAGHYYSYIQQRTSADEDGKWFEFNDSEVSSFDPNDLEQEAFGGADKNAKGRDKSRYGGMGMGMMGPIDMMSGSRDKSRNAYLLVYERTKPFDEPPAPEVDADGKEIEIQEPSSLEASRPVLERVWKNNAIYFRDRATYDANYFAFLYKFMSEGDFDEKCDDASFEIPDEENMTYKQKALALATRFVLYTLGRAFRNETFEKWIELLTKLYDNNPPMQAWFLSLFADAKTELAYDYFLSCESSTVRKGVAALICQALTTASKFEKEKHAYLQPIPVLEEKKDDDVKPRRKRNRRQIPQAEDTRGGLSAKLIDLCVKLIRHCPPWWETFDQFFRILATFVSLGDEEARYALETHNLLARMIDLYLADNSPCPEVNNMRTDRNGKRETMGDSQRSPDLRYFVALIKELICVSKFNDTDFKIQPPYCRDPQSLIPLSNTASLLLRGQIFLNYFLQEGSSRNRGQNVAQAICHMCWDDLDETKSIMNRVCNIFDDPQVVAEAARRVFRVIIPLCGVQDSCQPHRVGLVMSMLTGVMQNQKQYWKFTDMCIEQLIRLAKHVPLAREWIQGNAKECVWMAHWVSTYPQAPIRDEHMQIFKGGGWPRGGLPRSWGLNAADKRAALVAILKGQPLDEDNASDSDHDMADRDFKVGQWVDAMEQTGDWVPARIVRKWGSRLEVAFESDHMNDWVDKFSGRLADLGTYCSQEQLSKVPGLDIDSGDVDQGGVARRMDENGQIHVC